jgi:polysaccharide biosynthesis/export protein VpsN
MFRPERVLLALIVLFVPQAASRAQTAVASAATRAAANPVRPGDKVALHFLRDRELSETMDVDDQGHVAFPKIGSMYVANLSIAQLRDTLLARYTEYLRAPELEIAVLRRITINGEVKIPNVYLVDGNSTVRDVIARAGGVTEFANRNDVAIVRDGKRIRVKNWQGDGPETDLMSGDQVIVGRQSWLVQNSLSVISTAVLVTSFIISVARR